MGSWGFVLVVVAALVGLASAEDLYCGAKSCYETLGVEPGVESREITQAYRKLAREVRGVGAVTGSFPVARLPPHLCGGPPSSTTTCPSPPCQLHWTLPLLLHCSLRLGSGGPLLCVRGTWVKQSSHRPCSWAQWGEPHMGAR